MSKSFRPKGQLTFTPTPYVLRNAHDIPVRALTRGVKWHKNELFRSARDNCLDDKGFHWSVFGYGIKRSDGGYWIEAEDLTKSWPHEPDLYSWPLHARGKVWNLDIFLSAWLAALAIHSGKYKPALDPKKLKATINHVRRVR